MVDVATGSRSLAARSSSAILRQKYYVSWSFLALRLEVGTLSQRDRKTSAICMHIWWLLHRVT